MNDKSNFPEKLKIDSKFGSINLGHGWHRAKTTQRNVIHVFHKSWSQFKPISQLDQGLFYNEKTIFLFILSSSEFFPNFLLVLKV